MVTEVVQRLDDARAREPTGDDLATPKVLAVEPEQRTAFALIRKYSDQDVTLTDAIGLHLMAVRRIRICWSTDYHLGLTKVPLVIHL